MEFYLIHGVGAECVGTASGTATKIDFTGGNGAQTTSNYAANNQRQGVLVTSCGAAAIYAKVVGRGSGITPTITSTNYHIPIPAANGAFIPATREVDVWVIGSTAFTAVEVL